MSKLQAYALTKGLMKKKNKYFGAYKGYMLTLSENSKGKLLYVAAQTVNEEALAEVERFVLMQKNQGIGITAYEVKAKMIGVFFAAGRKDLEQLDGFLEQLLQKLTELQALGTGYCAHCGQPIAENGSLVQINGAACQMHAPCVERHNEQLAEQQQEVQREGSLLTGTVGALLGGIVGCIPWAIAYYFGWFVGWLGFLIGLAAKKGYEILKGKTCKAKGVVVILATVLGVLVAEFAALVISLMADPEIGLGLGEAVQAVIQLTTENAEVQGIVFKEILLGLVFAGLGIFSLAKDIFDDTSAHNGKALPL